MYLEHRAALVWVLSCEHFPHDDAEAVHVCLGREFSSIKQLRGHPGGSPLCCRCSSWDSPRETSAHGEGSEAPQGHKRQGRRDSEESSKHAKPIQLQIDYIVTRSKMPEVQGLWNQGATHGSNEMTNMSEARHNEMTKMSEAMSCYDGSTHTTQTYA